MHLTAVYIFVKSYDSTKVARFITVNGLSVCPGTEH